MTTSVSGVYLVTDTAQCGDRGVVATAEAAVDGGVSTVQVRAKDAGGRDAHALLTAVADAVGDRASVLMDDRVDVYLAARASGARVHGVHIGQQDLPAGPVRALVGPEAIVGLTANTGEHLASAAALPAGTVDYFGVGAVHATATKPDHPAPLGIDGFTRFAALTDSPCVAIGGIGRADVRALREAGAAAVAVVSAICTSPDPRLAAATLAREWTS